jgi:hypothetical protein
VVLPNRAADERTRPTVERLLGPITQHPSNLKEGNSLVAQPSRHAMALLPRLSMLSPFDVSLQPAVIPIMRMRRYLTYTRVKRHHSQHRCTIADIAQLLDSDRSKFSPLRESLLYE